MANLDSIDDKIITTRALGKVALPEGFIVAIDKLKISTCIFHSLGMIEEATLEALVYSSETRALAYLTSAMVYGDLHIDHYVNLSSYVTNRAAIRRELLLKT